MALNRIDADGTGRKKCGDAENAERRREFPRLFSSPDGGCSEIIISLRSSAFSAPRRFSLSLSIAFVRLNRNHEIERAPHSVPLPPEAGSLCCVTASEAGAESRTGGNCAPEESPVAHGRAARGRPNIPHTFGSQPGRYSRDHSLAASAGAAGWPERGSGESTAPVRQAMLPRWQSRVPFCPSSISAFSGVP